MIESGLQGCGCNKQKSRSSNGRSSTNGHSSFDCNSVFGSQKFAEASSNNKCCEICAIRKMCKDILMDIKHIRGATSERQEKRCGCNPDSGMKKRRGCSTQPKEKQMHSCGGSKQTETDSLCQGLTKILEFFGISPVETKP